MVKSVNARYNHNRWIADCPNCEGGAELVRPGEPFICRACHPGLLAMSYAPISEGRVIPAPDLSARAQAIQIAQRKGEVYEVVFPAEKEEIEQVCKDLRAEYANWKPGDSLADLRREAAEARAGGKEMR